MSTPGKKQVWRVNDRADRKSEGDYITLVDEDPRSKILRSEEHTSELQSH